LAQLMSAVGYSYVQAAVYRLCVAITVSLLRGARPLVQTGCSWKRRFLGADPFLAPGGPSRLDLACFLGCLPSTACGASSSSFVGLGLRPFPRRPTGTPSTPRLGRWPNALGASGARPGGHPRDGGGKAR